MIFLPDRPPICPGPIGLLVKSSQLHLHCSVHMGSTHDILKPISNHLFNIIPVSRMHIQRPKAGLLLRLVAVTALMYDSVQRRQKTSRTSWCYLSGTSHQWRTEGGGVGVFKPTPEIPKISVESPIA